MKERDRGPIVLYKKHRGHVVLYKRDIRHVTSRTETGDMLLCRTCSRLTGHRMKLTPWLFLYQDLLTDKCQHSAVSSQQSAVSSQQSAVRSHQSSVISTQSSLISHQSSLICHQSSVSSRQSAVPRTVSSLVSSREAAAAACSALSVFTCSDIPCNQREVSVLHRE